jgi:hypothetical protein
MKMGGPDLRLSGVIDRINLERVIDQLPHGYKEMFVLHDVEGYEHNEIAQILGAPSGIPNPSCTRPGGGFVNCCQERSATAPVIVNWPARSRRGDRTISCHLR